MIGIVLLYVGAVLFVNGIWLLGHIQDREVAILNVFAGSVGAVVAVFSLARGDMEAVQFAAYVLLFAFTYLWVAYNRFTGADGRGLGWYCLFVALTALPISIITLTGAAGDPFALWMGFNWAVWAVLWFLYFLLLALGKNITRLVGVVTILVGIATAWLLGFATLNGMI